jgi:hypothetical protein
MIGISILEEHKQLRIYGFAYLNGRGHYLFENDIK